jgi:membrane-associated phospholipid phosphatase
MEKQRPPVTDPHRQTTAEDTTAGPGPHPLSRSTVRHAQTPRAERTGDHQSHPGALPPAPGWLLRVLNSVWLPVVLLTVLGVLTEQVVTDGPLLAVDRAVRSTTLRLVADNPFGWLDTLAEWWTDLGSSGVAIPLLVAATLAAALRARSWKPLLSATLAGIALFATVIPGKILVGRPGPEGQPVGPGDWGWFPSGHTSTAGVCLGTAAWLLALGCASARIRRILYSVTAGLCVGVGLTLIWRDYHWFLDVVAGWCLSGTILWSLARWAPRAPRR